ncbi:MAG TPA: hypothetical protein VED59_05315, partial [Acidimicrobiales bacterium]|nr:hypothetical protein [Acidimicrobiales bacterium]
YWRACLEAAASPERIAPASERLKELESELADLERRLSRQILNLEAEDLTPTLRRRVGERVAELEAAVADRQKRMEALAQEAASEAPTMADLAPLLERLPLLATNLGRVPRAQLREMFESLALEVVYQPADDAVDVGLTLFDHDSSAERAEVSEDWLAPPAGRRQHGERPDRGFRDGSFCLRGRSGYPNPTCRRG